MVTDAVNTMKGWGVSTLADHFTRAVSLPGWTRPNQYSVSGIPRLDAGEGVARGTRWGRYEVREALGAGGVGTVYAAYDITLDRLVALKRLRKHSAHRLAQQRLMREAQAMARVSHPNVVVVYDVATLGDEILIAMEHVAGTTLRVWNDRVLGWAAMQSVLQQGAAGLQAAHDRGLVHRDFKPENVLVGDDGRVRVTDFGLARTPVQSDEGRCWDAWVASPLQARWGLLDARMTQAGTVVGTPAYMAPEQVNAGPVTPAADQFSFAVVAYEMIYGVRPFAEVHDAREFLSRVERGPQCHTFGRIGRVSSTLRAALRRGLARRPEARFPSVQALVHAFS